MSSRQVVTLRSATGEDAAALIGIWQEGNESDEREQSPAMPTALGVPEAATAIDAAQARPDARLVVALVGGEIVGTTYYEVRNAGPLTLTKVLVVTDFQVSPRHRRKGVAAALLTSAAHFAEEHRAVVVMAAVKPQFRDGHRYLTKLGFSQAAVVRGIDADVLTSRLAIKTAGSRDTGRLLAVRRGMRRRQGASQL
jgi:GNAT superfamily N-acetyltransferase